MIDFAAAHERLGLAAVDPCGAARLGGSLAALYGLWSGRAGIDLAGLVNCFFEPLGGAQQPLGMASVAVATAVMQWRGLPYHSVLHHAEVATNATVLAELMTHAGHTLSRHHRALLLAAAFSHDYLYQPGQPRFGAETKSANAMDAIAEACGVSPADRTDLCSLILATEPSYRRVLRGADQPSGESVPVPLLALLARPDLARTAALLSDADILSSSGLTLRWKQVQHRRLEQEFGRAISAREDLAFLDQIAGPDFVSAAGQYFTPNLRRIRAVCAGAIDRE
jgi:hypothetical protein